MVRAKLITGGNQAEREKAAQELIQRYLGALVHPDLAVIDAAPSVTIAQVRKIKKKISLKPYSAPVKIIFIPEAEKITYPAQNALLKTLEEPPGEALIILVTPKKDLLLPTIISRCEVIHLPEEVEFEIDPKRLASHVSLLTQILKSGVGERLLLAEKMASNRGEGIKFCQNQLVAWRRILRGKTKPSVSLTPKQITSTIRQIHQALIMLEANVNPRLVIENLLLSYPFPEKS